MNKMDEYNQNPNYCKQCGKPILCNDSSKLWNVKEKKFCNSSCAASFNNKNFVRNRKGRPENLVHNGKKCLVENFTNDEIFQIYNNSKDLLEFSNKLGYKREIPNDYTSVIKKLNSIGININELPKNKNNHVKIKYQYTREQRSNRFCNVCNTGIFNGNKSGLCFKCYNEKRRKDKLEKWLKFGKTDYKVNTTIRGCIREYIYKDQNGKCAICNMGDNWNGKKINFILDHIDGNASNNQRSNMRLICPNCDSQLDTFKSKNKNSARNFRKKYTQKYASEAS